MNQLALASKFGYSILLKDFANILPSHSTNETIAAGDVPGSYAKLIDAVVKAKGQLSVAKLDEQDKLNVKATVAFAVPIGEKPAFDKLLAEMGTLVSRKNEQAPPNIQTTERKFGYTIELRDLTSMPPRETVSMKVEVRDVEGRVSDLKDFVA